MTPSDKRREKKIIYIEWVDSIGNHGWELPDDAFWEEQERQMKQISVGFLIKETKRSISITDSYKEKGQMIGNVLTIPKVSILKTKYL